MIFFFFLKLVKIIYDYLFHFVFKNYFLKITIKQFSIFKNKKMFLNPSAK